LANAYFKGNGRGRAEEGTFFFFPEATVAPDLVCISLAKITHHRLPKNNDSSRKPKRAPSRKISDPLIMSLKQSGIIY